MLAAIRPSVASRSAWRIRASIARIAERSSHAPISPSRAPSPERSAEKVSRTGTAVPSGRRSSVSCRVDARGLASIAASTSSNGTPSPKIARHGRPIVSLAERPVISSAAPLNAVIRWSRSRAIRPVPTDWKTRSLYACRSRRSFRWVSSSLLVARNCSASPPATMATIRKVPALRNMVRSSRALVSPGDSKNTLVGNTVWPGTTPDGMTGPTASSSPASPSRAQANPRSSALTLSAFTTSLHHRDQLEDRQVHCDDEATDDDAEEHDHERLEQRRERGHRGVDLVVVEVGDLLEHLVESAGVLAHVDHVHHHGREHGTALQRLRQRAARGDGRARLHHRGLDDAVAS